VLPQNPALAKFINDPINFDDAKVEQAFSYQHIQRCELESCVIECKGYQVFVERTASKNFITLKKLANNNTGLIARTTGEKIHVSLLNKNDNIAKAWNIFKRHAINHAINHCKVICDSMRDELANDDQQRGKEITIYVFNETKTLAEWAQFLEQVTKEFTEEKIIPGEVAPSDYPIPGSNYFSYRNDKYISYKKNSPENKAEEGKFDTPEQNLLLNNNQVNEGPISLPATYQAVNDNTDEEYEINYESSSSDEESNKIYSSKLNSIQIVANNQPHREKHSTCSPCCKKCTIM
jgi:hypothetical protein